MATPLIADPTFERTVVLLLAHGASGAFGVVLNRPSETLIDAVVPDWGALAAAPGVVFVGGPVSPDSLVALGRSQLVPAGDRIVDDCAAVNLTHPPGHGRIGVADHPVVRWFRGLGPAPTGG